MVNLLTNTHVERIARTNFSSEPIIYNGKEVNREILNAITSIPLVKKFGFGSVAYQQGIIFEQMDGYIYQRAAETEEEFEILVTFDDKNRKFKVFTAQHVNLAFIFQAVLLADMDVNFSNIQSKDGLEIVPTVIVDEQYEKWGELAQYVQMLEQHIPLLEENTEIDSTFFTSKKHSVSDVEDYVNEYFEGAEMEVEILPVSHVQPVIDIDVEEEQETVVNQDVSNQGVQMESNQAETANEGSFETMETLEILDLLLANNIELKQLVDATGVSYTVLYNYSKRTKMPKKPVTLEKIRNGLIEVVKNTKLNQHRSESSSPVQKVGQPVSLSVKTQEKPKQQKIIIPVDENYVRERNAMVWNDLARERFLNLFDNITDKQKERMIAYAKYNRERLINEYGYHVLLDIPRELEYMGDSYPLRVLTSAILAGRHLAITGPTGCGKSTLIRTMACFFNVPLYRVDGNSGVTQSSYLGTQFMDEDGKVKVLDGSLISAMEIGGWFYFSEMNMTRGSSIAKTNSALDKQKEILNELKAQKQVAKSDFRGIVDFNPDYIDTNPINQATRDRVEFLTMDYMSQEHLAKFIERIGVQFNDYQRDTLGMVTLDREDVNTIIEVTQLLQDKENELTTEVSSIRNVEAMYEHLAAGMLDISEIIRIIIDKYPEQKPQILDCLRDVERLNITAEEIASSDLVAS